MSDKKKICPFMSGPAGDSMDAGMIYAECAEYECPLFIRVYSTENILQPGQCAYALQPQMIDGLLRV